VSGLSQMNRMSCMQQTLLGVMPGHSRSKNGVAYARLYAGHPDSLRTAL
jgi:hypothetical protein